MIAFLIGTLIILAWIAGIFLAIIVLLAIFGIILFSWAVSIVLNGERDYRG